MPYIKKSDREYLDNGGKPNDIGELNYVITKTILDYLNDNSVSYPIMNEIMGVLECTKQEFYKRVVSPYENREIMINGDVYN